MNNMFEDEIIENTVITKNQAFTGFEPHCIQEKTQ